MNLRFGFLLTATALAAMAATGSAHAVSVVDTGTPNGSAVGAYTLDAFDFVAGQFSLTQASRLQSISTHVLGGTAGETFTVAVYGDSAAHLPSGLLYSATATFAADGWNGVSGLTGWNLAAGSYWVGIELGSLDTLGSGGITGALLDRGAPTPLARTAFDAGSGWQASATPMSFGLRVDAAAAVSAVPEPSSVAMLLVGLVGMVPVVRRGK